MAPSAPDAKQLSPLIPGAESLEAQGDKIFETVTILAPPGVLERRYALAHSIRTLAAGGRLVALAAKDRGGMRLEKELRAFGCTVDSVSRRHHRICFAVRPGHAVGLAEAIAAGAPQKPPALGIWSQPGLFSWDRPDPGSLALLRHLPKLSGFGADFGCGAGLLSAATLKSAAVETLSLIDIDRRAIDAARRNIVDERARFCWCDVRADTLAGLDFVVMNPPFHEFGAEDRVLGESFIRRAASALRSGGVLWLVANRHLPYEAPLRSYFSVVTLIDQDDGFKVYEALR